jgi:hypothetical protein
MVTESPWSAAMAIAIKAKVMSQCEYHPDQFMLVDGGNIEDAYRIGNAKFTAGELKGVFETRREMTDKIKGIVDDYALDYCGICYKMLRD